MGCLLEIVFYILGLIAFSGPIFLSLQPSIQYQAEITVGSLVAWSMCFLLERWWAKRECRTKVLEEEKERRKQEELAEYLESLLQSICQATKISRDSVRICLYVRDTIRRKWRFYAFVGRFKPIERRNLGIEKGLPGNAFTQRRSLANAGERDFFTEVQIFFGIVLRMFWNITVVIPTSNGEIKTIVVLQGERLSNPGNVQTLLRWVESAIQPIERYF